MRLTGRYIGWNRWAFDSASTSHISVYQPA